MQNIGLVVLIIAAYQVKELEQGFISAAPHNIC